jgi:LysM repeat protein
MRLARTARTALIISFSTIILAGCSSAMRLGGPSWNLTSGRDSAAASRPTGPAAVAPAQPPTYTYRGGRDPMTGKAEASSRAPQGIERRELALPPVASAPTQPPVATAHAVPTVPPSRAPVVAGRRTVEVLPGHSLATIAAHNRVSIAALMSANKLRDAYVYPGQVLVLP